MVIPLLCGLLVVVGGIGSIVDSLLEHYRFLYYNGVDPNPLRRSDVEQLASLFSTSQALCVTTLLADNYVYMDIDSTEELVQMLFAEYMLKQEVDSDY